MPSVFAPVVCYKKRIYYKINRVMKKRVMSVFAAMAVSVAAWADVVEFESNELRYSADGELAAVVGYSGTPEEVVIPVTVEYGGNVYSVYRVEKDAFEDCASMKRLLIPSSVVSIGEGAFWGCEGLTSVEIPSTVSAIDDDAFGDCEGLETVKILSPNIIMGTTVFPEVAVDGLVYDINGPSSVSVVGCDESLTDVVVPETVSIYGGEWKVTYIGSSAFEECANLNSVKIPSYIDYIGDGAFPQKSINGVLYDVTSSTTVSIVGYEGNVTDVVIPSEVTLYGNVMEVTEIKSMAFENCKSLTSVVLPSSLGGIGYGCFQGCSNLVSVEIPSSVYSVEGSAFDGCDKLAKVVCLSESVPQVADDAFSSYSATLYVPSASVEAYQSDAVWSKFKQIESKVSNDTSVGEKRAADVKVVEGSILVDGVAPGYVMNVLGQEVANANLSAGIYLVNGQSVVVR